MGGANGRGHQGTRDRADDRNEDVDTKRTRKAGATGVTNSRGERTNSGNECNGEEGPAVFKFFVHIFVYSTNFIFIVYRF
jgi:hypothetical protein